MRRGKQQTRQDAGFTLIELLVAMGVVGVLLAAVLSWQSLTFATSARVRSDAARLQELSDASGYLADRVRSAVGLRLEGFTVNSRNCEASTPCLAIVVPSWDTTLSATNRINECLFLIYRFEPRSSASQLEVELDPWAQSPTNTESFVLREYRKVSTTSTGECSSALLSFNATWDFSAFQHAIVSDHLSLSNAAGLAFVPFEQAGSDVTLRFQDKQRVNGTVLATPTDAPYEIRVRPRNL